MKNPRFRGSVERAIVDIRLQAQKYRIRAEISEPNTVVFSDPDTGECLLWWDGKAWWTDDAGAGRCCILIDAIEMAVDVKRGLTTKK